MSAEENNQDHNSSGSGDKPTASGVRSEYRVYEHLDSPSYHNREIHSEASSSYSPSDKSTKGSSIVKWLIFFIALALAIYFISR